MELSGKFVFFENNAELRKAGTQKPSFIHLELIHPLTNQPPVLLSNRKIKVACWLPSVTYKEGDLVNLNVEETLFKGEKSYKLIVPKKSFSPTSSKANIRLGCLNVALTYYQGARPHHEEIINLAKEFEKWVTE